MLPPPPFELVRVSLHGLAKTGVFIFSKPFVPCSPLWLHRITDGTKTARPSSGAKEWHALLLHKGKDIHTIRHLL